MFFAKKKNDFYKISAHTQTLTYSFYISVVINMSFDFLSVNVHNVDVMFCKCCVIMFILRQNVISNKNVNVNINVVLNVKVFQCISLNVCFGLYLLCIISFCIICLYR